MKIRKILMIALGISLFFHAFATWQMVSSSTADNHGPFFQAGLNNNLPSQTAGETTFSSSVANANTAYEIEVYPGTLKTNLERIMKDSPYKLLWNSNYDYRVVSQASIRGRNFDDALNRLLMNYPVEAIFYEQNSIMTIVPRKPE